ncbi:MAG: hypothetical protein HYV62_08675 [Candidatus Rokubacteria bacterium]|nr:hypothetical protein [Candidatus Rokubacteria bacterium]
MSARPRRAARFGAAVGLALLALGADAVAAAAPGAAPAALPPASKRRPAPSVERPRGVNGSARPAMRVAPPSRRSLVTPPAFTPARKPRAYLIYLLDGGEPIVVEEYVEENGQIVFEKFGGWVRIPTYEIVRIVPDLPDRTANLPPPPILSPTGGAPLRPESDLYLSMRGGGNLRVAALTPEGDRVRVTVPDGSFTVPRSEILGVVRVPPGAEVPEAWLSVRTTEADADGAAAESAGLVPPAPEPRLPYPKSDHPHLLRLANGQLMRVEAFWVEDGEFRFRRLGGVVGVALSEVMRLIPEELVAVRGRTPVRFARQLAADLLEVHVRSGYHRVRLTGVEPVDGTWTGESPWQQVERGMIVQLEFDRQRYDAEGNWLAYVFLPSGRMLNAELIRLGMARPRPDALNMRYLDLFHEVATGEVPVAATEESSDSD